MYFAFEQVPNIHQKKDWRFLKSLDGSSQTAVTELLDDVIPLLHTSKQNNLLVSTPTNEQYSSTDGTATLMVLLNTAVFAGIVHFILPIL